ncbi:hypothetical protein HDU96_006572 [Phlyctochytrium bullatum]|nr:hypothetical protein HDU96_006572 [Phlyctochytrium bullatum]
MSSTIERIPVELARRITLHLHPEWLLNLFAASRTMRRLFVPGESELPFVRDYLRPQFKQVISAFEKSNAALPFEVCVDVPFRRLPDVYAVGWLAGCWSFMVDPEDETGARKAMACVVAAFPDLKLHRHPQFQCWQIDFKHGPHLPVAWMERIIMKALEHPCVRIKFPDECSLAFSLASLLDSVAVVEVVLARLFPSEIKSKDSAAGAGEVVVCANSVPSMALPDPHDAVADDHEKRQKRMVAHAWCIASVADQSAERGAIHLLNYALQHPQVPTAFCYFHETNHTEFLINDASRCAQMHVIHYLLGNPLPLAPPPASRPIRPGNLSGSNHDGLQVSGTEKVVLSPDNPVASLTHLSYEREQPLQNLLRYKDHDPLRAVTYLLDQGAPTNRDRSADLVPINPGADIEFDEFGPLHSAAAHGCPGIVSLLVKHGFPRIFIWSGDLWVAKGCSACKRTSP